MGKNRRKKPFIDPDRAIKFKLVPRAQTDPRIFDDEAPKMVLSEQRPTNSDLSKLERLRDCETYGIYYDDDYDYLQHLRGCDELINPEVLDERDRHYDENTVASVAHDGTQSFISTTNVASSLQIPSKYFETDAQLKVGIPNRKQFNLVGPQPHLDPDIIAALDDDFDRDDPNNVLDDDFVAQAMGGNSDASDDEGGCSEGEEEDVVNEDPESFTRMSYAMRKFIEQRGGAPLPEDFMEPADRMCDDEVEDDRKSRFTNYSLTSSVIRRNEQLKLLDDRFEQLFAEYDDAGEGGGEESGHVDENHPLFHQAFDEYAKLKALRENSCQVNETESDEVTALVNDIALRYGSSCDIDATADDTKLTKLRVFENERDNWDCESILTTYSNIYNHPKLIDVRKRSGIDPTTAGVVSAEQQFMTLEDIEGATARPPPVMIPPRSREESNDEKRQRKQLVKTLKRERRLEKKATKEAFARERVQQSKMVAKTEPGQRLAL